MLEFIVLGEVPGTSFKVTFSGVLIAAAVFGMLYLFHQEHLVANLRHKAKFSLDKLRFRWLR